MDDDITQLLNNGQMSNNAPQPILDINQQAAPSPLITATPQPVTTSATDVASVLAPAADASQQGFSQYNSGQYNQQDIQQAPLTATDLESVKQQALSGLIPLVDNLDQSAEDKFKTIMMIIQASDRSDLVQKALDAAQAITDQHVKAQSLLDIVNEVNYFNKKSSTASS